jgi:hypothetical protein
VVRKAIIQLLFFSLALVLLHRAAHAEILSGTAELFTQDGHTKTTDATGLTTEDRSRTFLQRYNLGFYSLLYPQVNFRAGLRVEDRVFNSDGDSGNFKATDTLLVPSVAITLTNPFVHAGAGYEKRDEQVTSGGLSTRNFRDTTNANLGFKPEGLPTLDLMYVNTRYYDRDHKTTDRDEDFYQLSTMYQPVRSLQLSYSAIFDKFQDRLKLSNTDSVIQNARVGYNDRFFNDRWMLTADVNATRQDAEFTSEAIGGTVRVQLLPVAGLAGINDTPQLGALSTNTALIDGNITVSSGINIGQLPSQTGDIRQRNLGLDFGVQNTVSTLYVWVDRPLPAVVANSFSWDIYTSPDNQNWFFVQTVFPANFGQFDNRFEISFSAVSARYVKVVTRPLSVAVAPPPGFDVSNIFITEIQAFFDQPVVQTPGAKSKTVIETNAIDLNSRLNIIRSERHSLLYDLYYRRSWFESTGQPPQSPSTLTNALIAYEKFSRVFSGSAKVMVENDEFANKSSETYTDAEASLMAAWNSLRKLAHAFTVTGKRETWKTLDQTRDTAIVSLTNNAEVYAGINAYLNAVKDFVTTETGTASGSGTNTVLAVGADIIPHRSLTLNTSYSWQESIQEGSATSVSVLGTTGRRTQNIFASGSYNPVSSLYLFGSVQRTYETGKPSVESTSFSGSWSSQVTGGALEFRLIYTENEESVSDTRTRTYGPYVKYRMNIRASLEVSYLISTIKSNIEKTDSDTLNTTFRLYF